MCSILVLVLTLYSFLIYFDWFSLWTEDCGRGFIHSAGGRGDKARVSFDCCCLFSLSPKSSTIALFLSQYRRRGQNPCMGEERQVMTPEQGDGRDYGTRWYRGGGSFSWLSFQICSNSNSNLLLLLFNYVVLLLTQTVQAPAYHYSYTKFACETSIPV